MLGKLRQTYIDLHAAGRDRISLNELMRWLNVSPAEIHRAASELRAQLSAEPGTAFDASCDEAVSELLTSIAGQEIVSAVRVDREDREGEAFRRDASSQLVVLELADCRRIVLESWDFDGYRSGIKVWEDGEARRQALLERLAELSANGELDVPTPEELAELRRPEVIDGPTMDAILDGIAGARESLQRAREEDARKEGIST
jgi:hypothetical protein